MMGKMNIMVMAVETIMKFGFLTGFLDWGLGKLGFMGGVILILVLSSTQTSVSSSSFLSIRISFLLSRWLKVSSFIVF